MRCKIMVIYLFWMLQVYFMAYEYNNNVIREQSSLV